jgi:hypothetical protein
MRMCVYAYTRICVCAYMRICEYAYVRMCVCAYVRMCVYANMRMCVSCVSYRLGRISSCGSEGLTGCVVGGGRSRLSNTSIRPASCCSTLTREAEYRVEEGGGLDYGMYTTSCMCECAYVRMYVYMYVRMCLCTYVPMCLCAYANVRMYMRVYYMCVSLYQDGSRRSDPLRRWLALREVPVYASAR